MKVKNKLTELHENHEIITKRADPKSPHYGYYYCETCNKFVTWITKEVYYSEKRSQKKQDTMWFGKYQGTKISELPDEYLQWVILNVDKNIQQLIDEYESRGVNK
jgi:hypothetical protein